MIESEIFKGFNNEEYNSAMKYINAGEYSYSKNQIILSAGDITYSTGLIISGSVIIESNDSLGNSTLIGIIKEGELFAVTYALSGAPLMVNVIAKENCRINFLRIGNRIYQGSSWSIKLTQNLLNITTQKNLYLSERTFINSHKTIRRKIMSYLNSISLKKKSNSFNIPFNRQQLADYLNVDRSSLSKELCLMRDKGIIEFHKNKFEIKTGDLSRHEN